MPIIFPEDTGQQRRYEEVVGRFRSGERIGNRPVARETWRVTTDDPEVADRIAVLLGGDVSETQDENGDPGDYVVDTTSANVPIIVEPGGIRALWNLWGRRGLIRACDGVTQTDGSPCQCARTLAERKEAAKEGTGCEPNTQVYFRLAADPEIGRFKFFSGSWSLAQRDANKVEEALEKRGALLVDLALETVEYRTKSGQERRFIKPTLRIKGPASEWHRTSGNGAGRAAVSGTKD